MNSATDLTSEIGADEFLSSIYRDEFVGT